MKSEIMRSLNIYGVEQLRVELSLTRNRFGCVVATALNGSDFGFVIRTVVSGQIHMTRRSR